MNPTICVLYSRNNQDFGNRMYAAGKLKGTLKVIGGRSSTWGNIKDIKKIEGEKFVITNMYHVPRLLFLDPELKIIPCEKLMDIPCRISYTEFIKYYITKIWQHCRLF